MSPLNAQQIFDRFRKIYERDSKHAINLARAKTFVPDRLLFRVAFTDADPERGFIPDPKVSPLATPAFIAGNISVPRSVDAELWHCGGEISHRDRSPYISCSRDLLWCLFFSGKAILKSKVFRETRIFIIADGNQYDGIQTEMYSKEYWDKLGDYSAGYFIKDRAKRFATNASEVLVYKSIGRERILGVLKVDREVLKTAGLDEVLFSHGPLRLYYYRILECIAWKGMHEQVASMAEWCEEYMKPLRCIGKSRICHIHVLFNALMFRLGDSLMNMVDDMEKEDIDEYLRHSFYYPWCDYLESHVEDHMRYADLNYRGRKVMGDIVPIPVFSGWTVEYWLNHYPSIPTLE
jgi:hypothetical protein